MLRLKINIGVRALKEFDIVGALQLESILHRSL